MLSSSSSWQGLQEAADEEEEICILFCFILLQHHLNQQQHLLTQCIPVLDIAERTKIDADEVGWRGREERQMRKETRQKDKVLFKTAESKEATILQHKQQAYFKYTNKQPTLKHKAVLYKCNRKDNNPDHQDLFKKTP